MVETARKTGVALAIMFQRRLEPAFAKAIEIARSGRLGTIWRATMKVDLPTLIRRFGKRLLATHISDNDGSGDQHRTPGYGRIHWPPVMAALAEIGYAGPFNLEIPGARHPLMELRRLKGAHALTIARWLLSLAS